MKITALAARRQERRKKPIKHQRERERKREEREREREREGKRGGGSWPFLQDIVVVLWKHSGVIHLFANNLHRFKMVTLLKHHTRCLDLIALILRLLSLYPGKP